MRFDVLVRRYEGALPQAAALPSARSLLEYVLELQCQLAGQAVWLKRKNRFRPFLDESCNICGCSMYVGHPLQGYCMVVQLDEELTCRDTAILVL